MTTPLHGIRSQHPAYATIAVSQLQSNINNPLTGSSIGHRQMISLRINEAELVRDLKYDRFHPGKQLIEVYMSPAQFSQMIMSHSDAVGTPCTLKRFDGKKIPELTELKRKQDQHHEEFVEDLHEITETTHKAAVRAQEILGGKILKADREELLGLIQKIDREVRANLPYAQEMFEEAMHDTVVEAKAEVEAYFKSGVKALGMEKLAEMPISIETVEDFNPPGVETTETTQYHIMAEDGTSIPNGDCDVPMGDLTPLEAAQQYVPEKIRLQDGHRYVRVRVLGNGDHTFTLDSYNGFKDVTSEFYPEGVPDE